MKAANFVSTQDAGDLPLPDALSDQAPVATNVPGALPRPLPAINDTGRIKFGAACRIPQQK